MNPLQNHKKKLHNLAKKCISIENKISAIKIDTKRDETFIKNSYCKQWHKKCIKLSSNLFDIVSKQNNQWYCKQWEYFAENIVTWMEKRLIGQNVMIVIVGFINYVYEYLKIKATN